MSKIPISVCIIAKNEERYIEECLKRLKPYEMEIIVTDTGSTDRTKEIAEKYADDIHYDSLSDYMDEVIFINHLEDGDQIKAGTYLTIPYYSTEFK